MQLKSYLIISIALVLYKPHFEKPHLVMGRCEETGKSKSAWIGPYSKFQKCIHDGSVSRSWPIMNILLKFRIGANSSTFGFPVSQRPVTKWGFSKWGLQRTLASIAIECTVRAQDLPAVYTLFTFYKVSAFLWSLAAFLWSYMAYIRERSIFGSG